MKLTIPFLALSFAACSSGATTYLPTKGAQASAAASSYNEASTQKYIYVGNGKTKQLLVYPAGVPNPSPIRTVTLGGSPQGVAVDGNGNVFVALLETSTIDVFSRGAGALVRTISNDIYKPAGVAVDEHNVLYVASHCESGCGAGYVAEFKPGSDIASTRINAPATYGIEGVAARNGILFMDIYNQPGGYAAKYVRGQLTEPMIGLAACAGLALDNSANLFAANAATLSIYMAPSYTAHKDIYQGSGAQIHFIGRGGDGTVYVPITGPLHSVVVYPPGSQPSYSITAGLSDPMGAAAD